MESTKIVKKLYELLEEIHVMSKNGYDKSLIEEKEINFIQLQSTLELQDDKYNISRLVNIVGEGFAENEDCELYDYYLYILMKKLLKLSN